MVAVCEVTSTTTNNQHYSPEPVYQSQPNYYNEPLDRYKLQPLPPIQSQYQPPAQPQPLPVPQQQSNYNQLPPLTPPTNQYEYQPPEQQYQNQQPLSSYEQNERDYQNYTQEKIKLRNELDGLSQYPFGRRYNSEQTLTSTNYESSMNNATVGYQSTAPYAIHEQPTRLTKDRIIEKPGNLDVPAYDPIKHKTGYATGYDYDPWGKPGGGAPLIDPVTGKKSTKKSGQIWYDKIGLNEDERAKLVMDKNRPLTLEEQKVEMEKELVRRKLDEIDYRSRGGADVATWINYLDDNKQKLYKNFGAHLSSTSATKEKLKQEQARRAVDARSYHDELTAQIEDRNRHDKLHKLKNDVAGIEHTKTYNDWWGRPGAGARNLPGSKKKIEDAFRGEDIEPSYNRNQRVYYQNPAYDDDDRYRSSHRNFYDRVANI